jgi:hypothetical protein
MDETTTNVNFEGKEAEFLSFGELQTLVKMFDGGKPPIANLNHNLSDEKMELFKNSFASADEIAVEKLMLYGIPVVKKSWIPLNEAWFVDKDGKVIKKFKF